jgi:hypothetical protein
MCEWSPIMPSTPLNAPIHDSQDLERMLIARQHAGDVDGMVALYEPDAGLDPGVGTLVRGRDAIRAFHAEVCADGRTFQAGEQRPALLCGDLAMTSTRPPDGRVTTEVARCQPDGSWLWVIDRYSAG